MIATIGSVPARGPVSGAIATPARLAGWGAGPRVEAWLVRPTGVEQLRTALSTGGTGAIARGAGRSYGDAAQLRGGRVIDLTALRGCSLDAERGVITAEAGATLGELLALAAPAGWVLPVVPGTQHVTVGGAIAADIHGKNHAVAGTFGRHVRALGLLTAAGELIECSRTRNADVFDATVGGMGLTGVVAWAQISLAALPSPSLAVDTVRVHRLDDALAELRAPGGSHRVAWLDLLGPGLARGVVTRAEPAVAPATRHRTTVDARATVPRRWPAAALRPALVRAHNRARFHRAPRREHGRLVGFGPHMFPLDALEHWPRLYGPAGLVQYQLVVPTGQEGVLETVLERLRASAPPCYLAVLKDLGAAGGPPLSFPIAGWTLALDLPRAAPRLDRLLDGFDELVAAAGGRVYLAKDGRLRAEMMDAMYPRLGEWRVIRDRLDPERLLRSDLGARTGMIA